MQIVAVPRERQTCERPPVKPKIRLERTVQHKDLTLKTRLEETTYSSCFSAKGSASPDTVLLSEPSLALTVADTVRVCANQGNLEHSKFALSLFRKPSRW